MLVKVIYGISVHSIKLGKCIVRFGCRDHGAVHCAWYELQAHTLVAALNNKQGFSESSI